MPVGNLDIHLLPFVGAVFIVVILGRFIGPLINLFTDPIKPENGWNNFLAAGGVIGFLESLLFTIAIIVGYPVFIGAWLAFKVAAKWQTWAYVIRLSELDAEDLASDEFEVRARFGTWLHARFIIGVLLNILISVIGAWCYLQLSARCVPV